MEFVAINGEFFTIVVSVDKFTININAVAIVATRNNFTYANMCTIVEGINILASQTIATMNSIAQFVLQVTCTQGSFGVNTISVVFTNN